jgi:FkbM family methyltransferase
MILRVIYSLQEIGLLGTLRRITWRLRGSGRLGQSTAKMAEDYFCLMLSSLHREGKIDTDNTTLIIVGAHIGDEVSRYFHILGRRLHVILVEPHPLLAKILRKRFRSKIEGGNIEVHECAVSDYSGDSILSIGTKAGTSSLIRFRDSNLSHSSVQVSVKNLADVLGSSRSRIILKIDTQGAEYQVLRGLQSYINQADLIYTEIHDGHSEYMVCNADEIDSHLLGFKFKRIFYGLDTSAGCGNAIYLRLE